MIGISRTSKKLPKRQLHMYDKKKVHAKTSSVFSDCRWRDPLLSFLFLSHRCRALWLVNLSSSIVCRFFYRCSVLFICAYIKYQHEIMRKREKEIEENSNTNNMTIWKVFAFNYWKISEKNWWSKKITSPSYFKCMGFLLLIENETFWVWKTRKNSWFEKWHTKKFSGFNSLFPFGLGW